MALGTSTTSSSTFSSSICLLGGGGHALVVAEAARLGEQEVIGFYDDSASGSLMHYVARWLGPLNDATKSPPDAPLILAFGHMPLRKQLQAIQGLNFGCVVHPRSVVSATSQIGEGVFIGAGAVVNCNSSIGPHAIINTRAVIEHNCELGRNVHVGPGAVLGGGVRIGPHTLLGINSTVKPAVTIGRNCIVGAGAVVVGDVQDNQIVVGVPARPVDRTEFAQRRSA